MKNLFLFSLLAFMLIGCSGSSGKSSTSSLACKTGLPASYQTIVNDALAVSDSPGVVVAIYSPEQGYRVQAFGKNNVSVGDSLSINHIFEIGSVMKNFRWLELHRLDHLGTIDLDNTFNTYLSSPIVAGVNLKHLMLHSGGLIDINDSEDYMTDAFADFTKEYTYSDMAGYFIASNGTNSYGPFTAGLLDGFTIGTDYSYSSYGPLIAGELVEQVTGLNYRDSIKLNIFTPLKMNNSSFVYYDPQPSPLAKGHNDATTPETFIVSNEITAAFSSGFGGPMYSTGCDMVIYTNNQFNNNEFFPTTKVSEMTTTTNPIGFGQVGLGVFKYTAWGDFWGHLGSGIHAHSSAIAHRLSDKLSIVVLANIDANHDEYALHFAIISGIGAIRE